MLSRDFLSNEVDVTFFVPCYNEALNIGRTLATILQSVSEAGGITYEILVVDDCSQDGTAEKVMEFQSLNGNANIRLVKNTKNMGLGRNYIDSAYIAKGEYYMLINGDCSEPKDAIVDMIKKVGRADMIIPYFGENDNRTVFRRLLSRFFTFLVNATSGYCIKYYNGTVIHLRFNVIRWHPDTHGFAYQAEIITRVLDEKGSYEEIKVSNNDREVGATKAFKIKNFLSVSMSLLSILLRRMRRVLYH